MGELKEIGKYNELWVSYLGRVLTQPGGFIDRWTNKLMWQHMWKDLTEHRL